MNEPAPRRVPPKTPRPAPAPVAESRRIAKLTAHLEETRAESAAALRVAVDEFWDGHGARTPLLEPAPDDDHARVVTFLWRDEEAEEVLLFVNRLTDERDLPASLMHHIPGTDIWHLSYRMGSDWRASYSFLPHYLGQPAPWQDGDQVAIRRALDHGQGDPRNPVTNRNRSGVTQSVVELPDAPPQPWVRHRDDIVHGALDRAEGPDGRTLWVYQPPVQADIPLPLLVVLDGEVWTGPQSLADTLDNLIHDGWIPPVLAILVDSGGREQRWAELDKGGRFEDYLAGDLLDWARGTYPVSHDREDVIVVGQSLGALTALKTVLQHPDRVGVALSQSASLWQEDLTAAVSSIAIRGVRAYIEVGTQEWVLLQPNRDFAHQLRHAGGIVQLAEYNGGHDYACWRGGIADGLRHLLAP